MKKPTCETCPYADWENEVEIARETFDTDINKMIVTTSIEISPICRKTSYSIQQLYSEPLRIKKTTWCGDHPLFQIWYSTTEQGKQIKEAEIGMTALSVNSMLEKFSTKE